MKRRGSRDEGQAAVELALVLPLVVLLLLLVVQVTLVARDQVLVVHAAREGARQAAVDADVGAVRRVVAQTPGLAASHLETVVEGRGGAGSRVTVSVSYHAPTALPLLEPIVARLRLEGRATMRVER